MTVFKFIAVASAFAVAAIISFVVTFQALCLLSPVAGCW